MDVQWCIKRHEGKPWWLGDRGGRGYRGVKDFDGASTIPKKPKWVNYNHFLERGKSGNIEKRSR